MSASASDKNRAHNCSCARTSDSTSGFHWPYCSSIGVHGWAADDERCAGLIDQDGVHFVHDGEIVAALDLVLFARGHAVVAEVIETELGVGAVGDVAIVLFAADPGRLVVQDAADGQAEKFINRPHPFGIARGEVIVDGDDVHAAAGEGVEINGQGGDEGFAFAGGHFSDAPAVESVPPINCTSKGIISQGNGCSRTMISVLRS